MIGYVSVGRRSHRTPVIKMPRSPPSFCESPVTETDTLDSTIPNPPKRVLVVDDDPEIIETLRHALGSRGYEVLIARNGNDGLAKAESEDPDLVILDMMMPERSGFLVVEKLRRTRPVPVRIIMITANEGSRHRSYAELLGVDDYLIKPFAMERLFESVQRLLGDE